MGLFDLFKSDTKVEEKEDALYFDKNGNAITDEEFHETLKINQNNEHVHFIYDDKEISEEEHLARIEKSKTEHIIATAGIYTNGEFYSDEQLEQEKKEKEFEEALSFDEKNEQYLIDDVLEQEEYNLKDVKSAV